MNSLGSDDGLDEPRGLIQRNFSMWPESTGQRSISRVNDNRAIERIVGATGAWRTVLERAKKVAAPETTVHPDASPEMSSVGYWVERLRREEMRFPVWRRYELHRQGRRW
jgi:hypothetical protein